ncbi:hypothetical protein [Psychrobacillus sp. MER TA 171]|uniref:hypothetical protein n=1 Tax=Psychrobacillus sp. MER TA 171 TaxID=2939577 RepID=UPI00203D91DE|nr:hypothetical protein [Psychrobacillus sp. MER TA 171]MCM3357488.1 hypothetical protein [Psychrobacillus sp. MER TA 171]
MDKPVLITVTHDPDGKSVDLFKAYHQTLSNIYGDVYLTISDESSKKLLEVIQNSAVKYRVIPKKGAANARRQALKFSLQSHSEHYHYCDLDRILTWIHSYPNELKRVVNQILNYDYLVIGRTEQAMLTHPLEWIETERVTNKIFSLEVGQSFDITAGSCAFKRECAKYIIHYSKALMTDAEWAMIAYRIAGFQLGYLEVNGLEYHEEVNGITGEMNESERWFKRLKLSYIISETARSTGRNMNGEE